MIFYNMATIPIVHEGGTTRFPTREFVEIAHGQFEHIPTKQHIDVRSAIKASMEQNQTQILRSFSQYYCPKQVDISVGNISRNVIPVPHGFSIFAVYLPTAIMGNVSNGEHCFPNLFLVDGNNVLIGTTAHQTAANPIGQTMNTTVEVFCYRSEDAHGWQKVLYSSLENLSKKNFGVSVLLLATAMELYQKELICKLASIKSPWPENWNSQKDALNLCLNEMLTDFDIDMFNNYYEEYCVKVIDRRNNFVHEHSIEISYEMASEAFCAAYEVLWDYGRLEETF